MNYVNHMASDSMLYKCHDDRFRHSSNIRLKTYRRCNVGISDEREL